MYKACNDNLDMCDFLIGELAVAARAFFYMDLEACTIRPAAVALGYIPAEVDVLGLLSSVGHEDLMIHAAQYHFLHSAATRSSSSGEFVVRGSCDALLPDNGPLIKYAALFDARPEFDCIRLAFMTQCGVGEFVRIIERASSDIGQTIAVTDNRTQHLQTCTALPTLGLQPVQPWSICPKTSPVNLGLRIYVP